MLGLQKNVEGTAATTPKQNAPTSDSVEPVTQATVLNTTPEQNMRTSESKEPITP